MSHGKGFAEVKQRRFLFLMLLHPLQGHAIFCIPHANSGKLTPRVFVCYFFPLLLNVFSEFLLPASFYGAAELLARISVSSAVLYNFEMTKEDYDNLFLHE